MAKRMSPREIEDEEEASGAGMEMEDAEGMEDEEAAEPVEDEGGEEMGEAEEEQEAPAPSGNGKGKKGLPVSEDEKRAVMQAMELITKLLYDNKKVRTAVAEMIRRPPHAQGIVDATMMLVQHAKEQGASVPDYLIAGVALKTLSLVMDLGLSVGIIPKSRELLQAAVEGTLRSLADSYGIDPDFLRAQRKEQPPGTMGLLE